MPPREVVARVRGAVTHSDRPRPASSPLNALVMSRIIDQSVLGLASLLLARSLGPAAFAPIAVLFTVNSLAIQMSDFGLGFAVYRTRPGEVIARRSLSLVRRADLGLCVSALVVGAALGGASGLVVAASGLLWVATSEAYVRKAAALKTGATSQVVRAEVAGAAVFAIGVIAILLTGANGVWILVPLLAKHLIEIGAVRSWRSMFAVGGVPARSGAEWLGQVMTYLVANVDYVLVGWLLGVEALSIYVIAFRLASAIPAFVGTPITQAAFLEFAAGHGTALERQEAYDRIVGRVARIGGAGALVLVVAAPFLPWILGSEWNDTAPILAVLAVAVPWRLLLGTTVAQAISSGAARTLVAVEGSRLIVTAAAVAVASAGGLPATAAAVSAATICCVAVEHRWSSRLAGVSLPRLLPVATVLALLALAAAGVALSI